MTDTTRQATSIAVATQVVQAFSRQSINSSNEPITTLSVQLHPAELGQLNIKLDQAAEQTTAQIVASEAVAVEMLVRDKDFLLQALAELGIENAEVDIQHRQTDEGPFHEFVFDQQQSNKGQPIEHPKPGPGRNSQRIRSHSDNPKHWNQLYCLRKVSTMQSLSSQVASVDYLSLLTIQLQNQDPIDPVDQEGLVNDLTQFSMLENIENLNVSFEEMLRLQEVSQGLDLVGKHVEFRDNNGQTATGQVEQIFTFSDRINLSVAGQTISLSDVFSVVNSVKMIIPDSHLSQTGLSYYLWSLTFDGTNFTYRCDWLASTSKQTGCCCEQSGQSEYNRFQIAERCICGSDVQYPSSRFWPNQCHRWD